MTVATLPATSAHPAPTGVRRLLAVCRLHAVSWPLLLAAPAAILAVTFAVNLTIFALIDADDETHVTGAVLAQGLPLPVLNPGNALLLHFTAV